VAEKNPTLAPEKVRAVITTNWGKSGYRPVPVRSIESYMVESNLDQDSDNFSIVIGDPQNILNDLLNRDNEIRVQLFGVGLDVSYLLTGIVDDVDKVEDGRITLTGRDNSSIAADTTAEAGKWRGRRANDFIEERARRLGVTTRFNLAPGPTKKTIKTDGSESEWELWYRLLRKEKQWLWFSSDGWLTSGTLKQGDVPDYYFGTPPVSSGSAATQYIPVERVAYKKTTQSRVGTVMCFYHSGGRIESEQDSDPLLDEWMKRPLKYIEDKNVHSVKAARKAVWEEIYEGKVGALEIQVSIPDLGKIIRQNRIAQLNIPEMDLRGQWFVVGSKISADESGFMQEVRLREKGYSVTRRVPTDPQTQTEPSGNPEDIAKCKSLCDVIPRWCQYFVNAAHQHSGNTPYDLFLATLVAMCQKESGFRNVRQSGTIEWFEWDGTPKHGINSLSEWKGTFANDHGESGGGVGPMQLTTQDFKERADQFAGGKVNEFFGNRWLPEANIMEGAAVLNGKGGNREETFWAAVKAYNGAGDAAEAYMQTIRRRVAQDWLPKVQGGISACVEEKVFTGKGITIPRMHDTTHCTSGLPGFNAYDFMNDIGGTEVFMEEEAQADPDYGQPPHLIDWRSGYGGWTFQLKGRSGTKYWFTHLDDTDPRRYHGQPIPAGGYVGRLTRDSHKAQLINGNHVHVGSPSWPYPGDDAPNC